MTYLEEMNESLKTYKTKIDALSISYKQKFSIELIISLAIHETTRDKPDMKIINFASKLMKFIDRMENNGTRV